MKRDKSKRTHFSNILPVHRPDEGLWHRIERDLNVTGSNPFSEKLSNKLPRHTPSPEAWSNIEKALSSKVNSNQKLILRGFVGFFLLLVTLFFVLFFHSPDKNPSDKNENPGQQLNVGKQDEGKQSSKQIAKKSHEFSDEKSSKHNENPLFIERLDDAEIGKIEKSNKKQNDVAAVSDEVANNKPEPKPEKEQENDKSSFTGKLPQTLEIQHISEIHISFDNGLNDVLKPGKGKISFQDPFIMEIGLFVQPFYTRNVSSLSNDWMRGNAVGLSFTARNSGVLFETGLIYSKIEFEDDFEIKYYSYQYLGSIICLEHFNEVEEVNEFGDTIIKRQYYPEVLEFFDSTYNEVEEPDRVRLSRIGIPILVGWRLLETGRFFTDLKTGLELSVITRKVIPGNFSLDKETRLLSFEDNQPDTYTVKWKYNLSLRVGIKLGTRVSVFGEPFYSMYLEKSQNPDGTNYPKPEEAGVRFGVGIEF